MVIRANINQIRYYKSYNLNLYYKLSSINKHEVKYVFAVTEISVILKTDISRLKYGLGQHKLWKGTGVMTSVFWMSEDGVRE
jgi:hypothetical protein